MHELTSEPPEPEMTVDVERDLAVTTIVLGVVERRAGGESLDDRTVIALHPELMPELGERLAACRMIRRTLLAAATADPVLGRDTDVPASSVRRAIRGYAIEGEIGAGSQGTVYAAIQESTGRRVAIKVLTGGPFLTARHRERLDREVDVLAQVDHPNVVGIIDRGRTSDGSFYVAMDLIEGPQFDEWCAALRLSDRASLQGFTNAVIGLISTAARAVQAVHERGIVHRDLKPSNVRVDKYGAPHILDFGFARITPAIGEAAVTAATVSGQIIGSLPWASPEQAAGRPDEVGPASDVYSIGIMLYVALVGAFPYRVEGSMMEVIANITTRPPARVVRLGYASRGRMPRDLWAILDRALAKRVEDRYPDARALADDLDRYLAGRPVHAAPTTPWWRRGRLMGTLSLAALTLASLLLFAWAGARPDFVPFDRPSLTNAMGMTFVRVAPVRAWIGSPLSERGRQRNEDQAEVSIDRPYWIGATEVTRGQYRSVMGALPADAPDAADDRPVTGVTHADATAYARELGRRDGRSYRLPSEAEWEVACRAGTTGPIAGTGQVDVMAWYAANAVGSLRAVATRSPNHWRLYDMHGNAAEWCDEPYGAVHPSRNSADLRAPTYVVRGGSVDDPIDGVRSAARRSDWPQYARPNLGFRLVLEEPVGAAPPPR